MSDSVEKSTFAVLYEKFLLEVVCTFDFFYFILFNFLFSFCENWTYEVIVAG